MRRFKLEVLQKLDPPRLKDQYYFRLLPPENSSAWRSLKHWWRHLGTAYAATLEGDRVIIEWEPVKNAQSYRVELASDALFTDVLEVTETRVPRFLWREAKPGRFFLRARSLDAMGTAGSYSPTSSVIVTYKPPRLFSPAAASGEQWEASSPQVSFRWQAISGTVRYRLQISSDPGFAEKIVDKTSDSAAYQWLTPVEGRWYWRVGALYASDLPWEWSKARYFDAKAPPSPAVVVREVALEAKPLPAPQWTSPLEGEEIDYFERKEPVVFAWEALAEAKSYQLKVTDDDGVPRWFKRKTNEAKVTGLDQGVYIAAVRGVDASGAFGEWSLPLQVKRNLKKIDAPQPVFPANGDELARRSKLELRWQKELGFDGYRLVLSRDENFADVVTKKTIRGDRVAVPLPDSGAYYWYVEGNNRQQKYAMRSDIQTFRISEYNRPASERIRILAALSPSVISNTMQGTSVSTNSEVANSLSVNAFSAFVLEGQYWLSESFGGEVAYHYKRATLFETAGDNPGSDQEVLAYHPEEFTTRVLYRNPFSLRPGSIELLGRAGYLYKSFFSYFAKSRTALGLVQTDTHNFSLGLGGKIPVVGKDYIETGLDINFPFASSGTEVVSASYIRFDTGYYLQYSRAIRGGFAYRFGRGSYDFRDVENGIDGTLLESTHTLMASLGYGF